jgi:hypothetical protein
MALPATKIIEATRELLKAFGYFVDNLWHVDDVHFICEQQGFLRLSDEEAMEVFHIANLQFDGETGVSWPQLERALRTYLQRQIVMADMCMQDPAA